MRWKFSYKIHIEKAAERSNEMTRRLSWNQIREWYHGHWVELIDFEWEWDQANPTRARVRNYSSDRKELLSRIRQNEAEGAVILYVGPSHSLVAPQLSHEFAV